MPEFTVSQDHATGEYSITGPNKEEGEIFDFGTTATVLVNGVLFYCHLNGPADIVEVYEVTHVRAHPAKVDVVTFVEPNEKDEADEDEEEEEEEDEQEDDNPGVIDAEVIKVVPII